MRVKKENSKMMHPKANEILEFLSESNAIEKENSLIALEDATEAWDYAMSLDFLTTESILKIHQILMKRLRPDIAGGYRTCSVWIGGKLKRFLGRALLESLLTDNVNAITDSFRLDDSEREKSCKDAHVQFENVHPFEDGNGRTGRIIYNWHRLKLGLPLHIIHAGKEQFEYYRWFEQQDSDN